MNRTHLATVAALAILFLASIVLLNLPKADLQDANSDAPESVAQSVARSVNGQTNPGNGGEANLYRSRHSNPTEQRISDDRAAWNAYTNDVIPKALAGAQAHGERFGLTQEEIDRNKTWAFTGTPAVNVSANYMNGFGDAIKNSMVPKYLVAVGQMTQEEARAWSTHTFTLSQAQHQIKLDADAGRRTHPYILQRATDALSKLRQMQSVYPLLNDIPLTPDEKAESVKRGMELAAAFRASIHTEPGHTSGTISMPFPEPAPIYFQERLWGGPKE